MRVRSTTREARRAAAPAAGRHTRSTQGAVGAAPTVAACHAAAPPAPAALGPPQGQNQVSRFYMTHGRAGGWGVLTMLVLRGAILVHTAGVGQL